MHYWLHSPLGTWLHAVVIENMNPVVKQRISLSLVRRNLSVLPQFHESNLPGNRRSPHIRLVLYFVLWLVVFYCCCFVLFCLPFLCSTGYHTHTLD